MGLKRFLCAVFALVLVGASVINVAAVFADELAGAEEDSGGSLNINEPEGEGTEGEGTEGEGVGSAEGADLVEGVGSAEGTGSAEGAGLAEVEGNDNEQEVLRAAPVNENSNLRAAPNVNINAEPIRAGGDEILLAAAPTMESYDYEMELADGTKNLNSVDVRGYRYQCSVTPVSGTDGMTCTVSNNSGRVTVTATKAGEYTVNITRKFSQSAPNVPYQNFRADKIAVYNLDVTGPESVFYYPNDTVSYSINDDTFGDVHTTISLDGEVIDEADGFDAINIDTSEEGKYSIDIVNTTAVAAGFTDETYHYDFYVVNATSEYIAVEQGETVEISADSIYGIDSGFELRENATVNVSDGVATIDTSEMEELGIHPVFLFHNFGNGMVRQIKFAMVVVYSINAIDGTYPDEDYTATADTLRNLLKDYMVADSEDAWNELLQRAEAIFGETYNNDEIIDDEEYEESAIDMFFECVYYGCEMTTGASVEELDEADVDEELVAKMAELGAENVKYYDITAWVEGVYDDELVWSGQLHQLDGKIIVAVPYDTTGTPADGYVRTYYVVRCHDGEIEELVEGEDFYVKDGVIYIIADKFSAYAVGYKDALAPVVTVTTSVLSPNTGETTSEGASASSNMVVAVMIAVTVVTLVAAAKIAVSKKQK